MSILYIDLVLDEKIEPVPIECIEELQENAIFVLSDPSLRP